MTRLNPRLAAGVGVVSMLLLIGGPGAATVTADPGGSRGGGSDRGSSSDRDGGHDRGGSKSQQNNRGDRHDAGNGRRGNDGVGNGRSNRAGGDRPQSRVGSGRDDLQPPASSARAGANARGPVAEDPPPANPPALADRPAADAPATSAILAPRFGADGGGSEPAAGPATAFQPPRVTVGNGREPGLQSGNPVPRWQSPAPAPAPAPAPPSAPAPPPQPALVHRVYAPPAMPSPLPVAPTADWNSLWGIAGLLLIPAAGAALGYRQARAAQMAERVR